MSPINRMLAKHRRAGRPAVGLIENLGSPEVAELMAASGPDWLAIDCEHARITPERLAHMVRGVQSVAATPILARLPDHSVSWCKWALDAGVTALAAPMVDSAAEAQRFVQQSLLPPAGRRSWGGGRAPLHFGDEYLDTINDRLVLLAQIESAEGLAAVDAILAVPGLSGILVGPEDLSRALGVPRSRLFAAHDGTLAGLAQRARARGRCSSIWVRDLGEAARAIACGFDLVGLYPSAWVVRQQAKAGVEAFRAMADGRDAAQSQRGAGV